MEEDEHESKQAALQLKLDQDFALKLQQELAEVSIDEEEMIKRAIAESLKEPEDPVIASNCLNIQAQAFKPSQQKQKRKRFQKL